MEPQTELRRRRRPVQPVFEEEYETETKSAELEKADELRGDIALKTQSSLPYGF